MRRRRQAGPQRWTVWSRFRCLNNGMEAGGGLLSGSGEWLLGLLRGSGLTKAPLFTVSEFPRSKELDGAEAKGGRRVHNDGLSVPDSLSEQRGCGW